MTYAHRSVSIFLSYMPITEWILYADHLLDPIWRSQGGSYMPIIDWILYGDLKLDPICKPAVNTC